MLPSVLDTLQSDPLDGLTRAELVGRVECVRELKAGLAAYEAQLAVAIDALGDGGLDGRGVLRSNGRVSGRTAARVSATAHALEEMPKARAALQAGRITIEHAHALAKAGAEIDPESADSELVDIAESGPADIFAKRACEWTTERQKTDPKPEHDQQRWLRSLKRWDDNATGMRLYLLALDRITGQELDSVLERHERTLWEADGGRNADPTTARTTDQRLCDAMVELLTGSTRTGEAPPHPKHNVTAVLDIAGMITNDGTPLASLVQDGKPLPNEVLERLMCVSSITPVLFDGPARPIWVGRDHRTATIGQWRALIARDRGCIGCGANPNRCEAHHITPWLPFGQTDIDNLVLVCTRCHHNLHDRGHTLHNDNGRWVIRPPNAPPPIANTTNFPTSDFPTAADPAHLTLTA